MTEGTPISNKFTKAEINSRGSDAGQRISNALLDNSSFQEISRYDWLAPDPTFQYGDTRHAEFGHGNYSIKLDKSLPYKLFDDSVPRAFISKEKPLILNVTLTEGEETEVAEIRSYYDIQGLFATNEFPLVHYSTKVNGVQSSYGNNEKAFEGIERIVEKLSEVAA